MLSFLTSRIGANFPTFKDLNRAHTSYWNMIIMCVCVCGLTSRLSFNESILVRIGNKIIEEIC